MRYAAAANIFLETLDVPSLIITIVLQNPFCEVGFPAGNFGEGTVAISEE